MQRPWDKKEKRSLGEKEKDSGKYWEEIPASLLVQTPKRVSRATRFGVLCPVCPLESFGEVRELVQRLGHHA